jgi:DNA-binding IclR family transcriptional regulator
MAPIAQQVLRELVRRHNHAGSTPSDRSIEASAADVARHLSLSQEEVENALEMLVDYRAVTRHSLGNYRLTPIGLQQIHQTAFPPDSGGS